MNRRPGLFLILALLLAASVLLAQEADELDPAAPDSAAVVDAELTEFDNGLRLLVLPRPDWKLAHVDVYLSLRGAARNGGMAHLVEHLMFRSSENCPAGSLRDSLRLLTVRHQGTTSPRNVHLSSWCLPRLLPRLLRVESERLGRLRPDATDLEQEKRRVLAEGDFRKEVYPAMALNLRVLAMAYEGHEAAGDPLLGSPADIAAVGLAQADSFITRWLRPDRAVVLVAGPVDPDSVRARVAATFGALPVPGPAPTARDLPPRPDPRRFVTRSGERYDMLAVGFRLPYGTPEEAAVVHLTESIMDREDGHPNLYVFEDEALLILHVAARWSKERSDSTAAVRAVEQFWKETRTVKHRVRNDWLFARNRTAHVEELRERMNQPRRRASWRAQRLADDRELPAPDVMAAMVDSLPQQDIIAFFNEQFVEERAFVAFAAGRAPEEADLVFWNRGLRLKINPYLLVGSGARDLTLADIAPVLARAPATALGRSETTFLSNGIPVHVLPIPEESDVCLGGVRTYPCLEDEAPGRDPGRLRVYRWLAGAGYDRKGGNIEPRGEKPGWHTYLDPDVAFMDVTAHGPVDRFADVAAAMHKRLDVDRLNPFALRWYKERHGNWVRDFTAMPAVRAWDRRSAAVFGPDHPWTGRTRPDAESVKKWSVEKANRLHRRVCETGNLELVVAGTVDVAAVRRVLDPTFGRRDDADPQRYPTTAAGPDTVRGWVVPDSTSAVAVTEAMFPPRPLADEPPLGPVDLLVLEHLVEERLRLAVAAASLDSVSVEVGTLPVGSSVLPVVRIVSPPAAAAHVRDLLRRETARLASDPPDADEEARARLQVLGPLLVEFLDGERSRDRLVSFGLHGEIPDDPLRLLAEREYGLAAASVAGLFPADRYAWTVTGDTTRTAIREMGAAVE